MSRGYVLGHIGAVRLIKYWYKDIAPMELSGIMISIVSTKMAHLWCKKDKNWMSNKQRDQGFEDSRDKEL